MSLSRYLRKKLHASLVKREERTLLAQWFLLFGEHADPLNPPDPETLHRIVPPDDRFYADPFLVHDQGRHFIFFEEYPFADPVGFISAVEVFADGAHGEVRPVIRTPYHLSYPVMFQRDGQWFMMPESHQHNTIEIWTCEEFPWRWRLSHTLMEGVAAVDTTPLYHRGEWWLFTALRKNCKKFGDKLFLFRGDDLFGAHWEPHPLNPVRQGILYDRPAGNIIVRDDRLYRPVQDSLTRYGGAMELREITVLSRDAYAEHCVRRMEPTPGSELKGMHTYNAAHGWVVMDALRLVPRGA